MGVQSVIIEKKFFSLKEAKEWILSHGYYIFKIDETKNYYRFRQQDPSRYKHYFTKNVAKGVDFIIGYNS